MWLARLMVPSERRRYCAGRRGRIGGLVRKGDGGFSVVEIIVAMGVFALVATFMAQTLGSGLRGVLLGKRREVATQVANEMLEKARSLSFNAIGHISPLEPDPAIDNGIYGDEPLVFVPDVPGHPFDPHIEDLVRGSTNLTRYIYITWADNRPGLKRITVRVTWTDAGTQGPQNEVRVQTLVNASGLIPTGAGGMPLTARTFASGGSLNVSSSLLGLGSDLLGINLPTTTGSSTFRAVQNATCTTTSTRISALGTDVAPGYSVTATADDDSRTATPPSSSDSKSGVIWESPLPPPLGSLVGGLINSPVSCEANAESLAHEEGEASALSLLNLTDTVGLNLNLLGINLITWLLNLATLQTLPVIQEISHQQGGDSRELHASSATAFESIRLLDLPILDHGLVRLDGISAGASVVATDDPDGDGHASVTAPAFTIRILDATNSQGPGCQGMVVPGVNASRSGSYCVVTIDPAAAGFPGLTIPINGNLQHHFRGTCLLGLCILDLLGGILRTVDVGYKINLAVLPPTSSPDGGETGPNGERRWAAEYSPISVSAELTATLLGIELINAAVDLDLGTVRAEACAGATCS